MPAVEFDNPRGRAAVALGVREGLAMLAGQQLGEAVIPSAELRTGKDPPGARR